MTSAPATIPPGIGAIDPAWLSAALGAAVTDVVAERIAEDSGFSALVYRLHLTGDHALPSTVIAKLPAESDARGAMEMLGGYRRELTFYAQVAGRGMDTPRVYVALIDDNGVDFILLLEDLGEWNNADHLAGLSLDHAEVVIDALAGLRRWSIMPSNAAVLPLFPIIDAPIVRADNLFFFGDRLKVVDFQFACLGCGPADIAYLVSQGLPAEVRRGHDEALLRTYLHGLAGADYSFDEAWRHYRIAVGYMLLMPVVSLIGWEAKPDRARALYLELIDRSVAAIDEIDAVDEFV